MLQIKKTFQLTDRSSIALDRYLVEIARYPLLTPDEEVELCQLVKQGDKRAKEKLIKSNLRFVVSVAKQYQRNSMPLIDIINEGNIGLIKAVERFDDTHGFKFISYAVWWIRQTILEAISTQSRTIRLPINQVGNYQKIKDTIAKFQSRYYTIPSAEEIANITGIKLSLVSQLLENRTESLDTPVKDTDYVLSDTISNDNKADSLVESKERETEILSILKENLKEKEFIVITNFFGIGCPQCSLDTIAIKINLTRERTRQIRERALVKLARIKELKFI